MKSHFIPVIIVFFIISFAETIKAQIPAKCIAIESILVDACGNPEENNEMLRLRVGQNPISIQAISFSWATAANSWNNFCQNATTNSKTAQLNANNLGCGVFIEPNINGNLAAGSKVLVITSENFDINSNPFNNLNDTVYLLFQCAGNTQGHFGNYSSSAGLRTTILNVSGAQGCADTLTYDRTLLTNQNGGIGGNAALRDGARVDKSFSGNLSYVNQGCNAPLDTLEISFVNDTISACPGQDIELKVEINLGYQSLTWSGGDGVYSDPNNDSTSYTLANSDNVSFFILLEVTNLCGDIISDSVYIDLSGGSQSSINNQNSLCPYDNAVQLSAVPNVGVWTSSTQNAISNSGFFDPSEAGEGTHQVIFIPSDLCFLPDTIDIVVDSLPDASFTLPSTICDFDLPYQIDAVNNNVSWVASPNPFAINQNGVFNPNSTGNFTIIHAVSENCINADTLTVTVSSSFPPNIIASNTNICIGDSASISIQPIGVVWTVTAPNAYNDTTGIFDSNISGSGVFNISVHDSLSCLTENSLSITVNDNYQPEILSNLAGICINSGNINLLADSLGGTWSVLNQNNAIINSDQLNTNNLIPGNYTLIYDLQSSCSIPDTLGFTIFDTDTTIISGNTQFCETDTSFQFTINTNGGTWNITPNTSAFNNGVFNPSLANVGIYTISYNFPSSSCITGDSITIEVNSLFQANILSNISTLCENDNNILLVSDSIGGNWEVLNQTNAISNDSLIVENLSTGNYTLIYSLPTACSLADTLNFSVNILDNDFITSDSVFCENDLSYNFTSSNPNGTWSILPNNTALNPNGSFNPNNAGAGNYEIIFSPSGGVCVDNDTLNIVVNAAVQANISSNLNLCENDNAEQLNADVPNGNWISTSANPNIITNSGIFNSTISGVGTFEIIYETTGYCQISDTINISVLGLPTLQLSQNLQGNTFCKDEGLVLVANYSNGIISWNNGESNDSLPISQSGTYVATVSNACGIISDSLSFTFSNIQSNFTPDNNSGTAPLVVNFTNTSINAENYIWIIDSIVESTDENFSFEFENQGQYVISLVAFDTLGCSDTSIYEFIDIDELSIMFIPNVFTPNGDGLNDVFKAEGNNFENLEGQIYNRWGQLIFEINQKNAFWDGRTTSGIEAPVGVYFYIIQADEVNGNQIVKQGNVTLLR